MIGLSEIVLQVGLCSPIERVAPATPIAIRVRTLDRLGDVDYEKTFQILRGESDTKLLSFSSPPGTYHVVIEAPKYRCAASDDIEIIADHNRAIAEALTDGPPQKAAEMQIFGAAPPSFLYAKPSFVLLNKDTKCGGPIGDIIPANIPVENDQDSYYSWFYPDPTLDAHGPMLVAVKLATATGEYHYIRLKIPFPVQSGIGVIHFDVSEDMIDDIAGNQPDTLLCLKMWETSVR